MKNLLGKIQGKPYGGWHPLPPLYARGLRHLTLYEQTNVSTVTQFDSRKAHFSNT